MAHLRNGLLQVASTDDENIIEHMRDAYVLLGGKAEDVPLPWEVSNDAA